MKKTMIGLAMLVGVGMLVVSALGCGQYSGDQSDDAMATTGTGITTGDAPRGDVGADEGKRKAKKRRKVDEMADEALQEVFARHKKAKELYDNAAGWAAFDNLKLALLVSGGGGNGVAVHKTTGHRTYMKTGTGGVGLGLGGQKYQVVFLFQDSTTFNSFIGKNWKANAAAQAAAGKAGANAATDFVNGIATYQITSKGLMASADIAGARYWQNKKLNQ